VPVPITIHSIVIFNFIFFDTVDCMFNR